MPDVDLDTDVAIAAARCRILVFRQERTSGQPLTLDQQDQALAIAHAALQRLRPTDLPEPDTRERPAWLEDLIRREDWDARR